MCLGKIRKCIVITYCAFLVLPLHSQMEPNESLGNINNDSRREEIQRYFGYEDLFYRYTTLPYDISQNTNENAIFLDIGYLYILFLPLILVFITLKKRTHKILGMLGLTLYLMSCLYFSKVISTDGTRLLTSKKILEGGNVPMFDDGFIAKVTAGIYEVVIPIFHSLFTALNGTKYLDGMTYPIILIAFIGIIFLAIRIEKRSIKNVVVIFLCFSFLFFLLSAGIIWYGFLMIPLSLFIILYTLEKKPSSIYRIFLKNAFYSMSGLWILLAIVLRISNIQTTDLIADQGKNILFSNVFSYSVGHSNEGETLAMVFPNINKSLEEINNSDKLIYKVGTSLNLHINDNQTRIYGDNQLAMFYSLYNRFGGGKIFFKLLKEYGFGYLIVDLHTDTIDKTPDQSLSKKYRLLLETIFNNPDLYLISTDRILKTQDATGQIRNVNGIFGEPVYIGSYAVFKIL